jgi:hypothetical protein
MFRFTRNRQELKSLKINYSSDRAKVKGATHLKGLNIDLKRMK